MIPVIISQVEMRWVLKTVYLRSCLGLNDLFKVMFLDSAISKNFQLSKNKCGYYITYVECKLSLAIKESPFITRLLNESLNSVVQKE